MKLLKVPVAPSDCRQLRLLFDAVRLSRLSAAEQNKVRLVLAQILMQAAGLIVEGLGDDGR
jgi:hypothetical protein